jgi:hypothetical protein
MAFNIHDPQGQTSARIAAVIGTKCFICGERRAAPSLWKQRLRTLVGVPYGNRIRAAAVKEKRSGAGVGQKRQQGWHLAALFAELVQPFPDNAQSGRPSFPDRLSHHKWVSVSVKRPSSHETLVRSVQAKTSAEDTSLRHHLNLIRICRKPHSIERPHPV